MTGQTNQIIITTTGTYGPPCMMKVIDGWWNNALTIGNKLVFNDAAGNVYIYTCTQPDYPTALGKLDWIHGPIVVTELDSGEAFLILGNK